MRRRTAGTAVVIVCVLYSRMDVMTHVSMIDSEKRATEEILARMPALKQIGPSCGSTCLSMCLEFQGLPMDPKLIEERIHPYGHVDLGEVPFAMANFAKRLGMRAQSYCHGTLEGLAEHLRNGCVVIVMINYRQGTGHLVTLLGFDRDDGRIVAVRVRNPWGFDETMPAEQFGEEWHCLRQSRKSKLGCWLPVFDAGYMVIAPSHVVLPTPPSSQVLHSAPVDVLVTAVNGIGGSFCTISAGHWLLGIGQLLGNVVATLGGLSAYVLGNFVGLNLEFWGHKLRMSGSGSSVLSQGLEMTGWCLSMVAGVYASAVQLATWPLRHPGEAAAAADAVNNAAEKKMCWTWELSSEAIIAWERKMRHAGLTLPVQERVVVSARGGGPQGLPFNEVNPAYEADQDIWGRTLGLRTLQEALHGDVSQPMPRPVLFPEEYQNFKQGRYVVDDCPIS
eukprot:s29_g65.t1